MKHLRSRLKSNDGAAAVEFALVLPILTLVLFGIVEFGRGYNAQVSLTGAAREGARHMAINGDIPTVVDDAKAKVVSAAVLTPAPSVAISVGGAADVPCSSGADVTVTATYPLDYSIPMFGAGTWNVQGTAVMRCGG